MDGPITAVPLVLPALKVIATDAMPSITVFLGPPPGGDIPQSYAAVGYGGTDRPDVVGGSVIPSWGNRQDVVAEDFNIWCVISVSSGDQDTLQQLLVVDKLFAAFIGRIQTNSNLDGLLEPGGYATLGMYEWLFEDGGSVATVFFQVSIHLPWIG